MYIGRLALAMKRQVVEKEEIHTTDTTPDQLKDAYVLGSWVRCKCKMHQLRLEYEIRFSISISDFLLLQED